MGELWEKWWPTIVGALVLTVGALFWARPSPQATIAEEPAPVAAIAAPPPAAQSEAAEDASRERQREVDRLSAALRAAQDEAEQSSEERRPAEEKPTEGAPPERPMQLTERSPEVKQALGEVEVELFETGWCKYCRKTRAFLDQSRIRYRAYDVEADPVAKARKSDLAPGSGVPVVVIDEQVLVGFSDEALNSAFQAAVGRRLRAR